MDSELPSIQTPSPLLRLQRLATRRQAAQPQERCELCGATIAAEHQHLLELNTRQLACACDACAILFSSGVKDGQRYRRVPRRVLLLPELEHADEVWDSLHIPINLAFFYHSAQAGRVIAMYPSPAGATESLLPMDAWAELTASSSALRLMQSDVEALLINHVGKRRDCFLVSIDECYRLVGIIRAHWRGLSGGREVWQAITAFFDELHRRATGGGRAGGVVHA
jgi:hypothetical protein